jgi:hypothetical protein
VASYLRITKRLEGDNAMRVQKKLLVIAVLSSAIFASCNREAAAPAPAVKVSPPFKLSAGVQDIMAFEIDPAADALWESVSIESTRTGTVQKQPHTDEEWKVARGHAITLAEAANLLMMDGRRVAAEGRKLEDTGTPGNLSAEESQKLIDTDHETFVGFSVSLHDVGVQMLKAIDAKDATALMDAGAALDQVCEGCHLKFWYPGQNIPAFQQQAPEVDR